jgi:hypothetical protein
MTDHFTAAYIEAAVWADCDSDHECHGLPWAEETDARFAADAAAFYAAHEADILAYEEQTGSNAGHDLWFTRCGHGVGYWEHAGLPCADRLDAAAKALGGLDLYAGDDGKVYAA